MITKVDKWCKKCYKLAFDSDKCPDCGSNLQTDIPTKIYWCDACKVPILENIIERNHICPLCNSKTKYLASDVRPVFPEERLLIEILHDTPLKWINDSVWACDNRYLINGHSISVKLKGFSDSDILKISSDLNKYSKYNNDIAFKIHIDTFIKANSLRFNSITSEAKDFIINESQKFRLDQTVISFSGGKDSTVTADLVIKALRDPTVRHIFADTTLEIPYTYEYKDRYRAANRSAIFKTAKNKDQDFLKVCEDIGPPSRVMRWCCTMFKTGPITRALNSAFRDENILTFYGIRKSESLIRSKYNRYEETSNHIKIQKQAVASPIFFWSDFEIWLYILSEDIDFNYGYRLGFDRIGCWCCPNNNDRSQFLARIYMPEKWKIWHDYLISFAKMIGKPDPVEYIDGGWWKARQGGNGVESSSDIKIKQTNCTTDENANIYNLNKPITEDFYSLFIPMGIVSKGLGNKVLGEVLILDIKSNVPIISIQPFNQSGYDYSVKIKTLNTNHKVLHRMISYQIKKYNACRRCLKCESICNFNAITITSSRYYIDENKCKRCKKCVTAKYLNGGCLMTHYLRTKY
ncbi:MAG: phosphoadenosine phosphosulfate reductase family protein [Christensenellaceae bacterium]|jgi:phosphoadenosine phosphosulfate reductase|nr:phosphoadenosine phosphosulfate reductase family protein [Christensenellaceae bacterium]